MRKAEEWKNVFCLEGLWEANLKINYSVEPVLSLLNKQYPRMKYIYGSCATVAEFKFYLNKWTQASYDKYPILYLASHGNKGSIEFSHREKIEITEIAQLLEGKCNNKIIIFASCGILDLDKSDIDKFIKITNCLAVCGYRNDVDWIKATAFELLLLEGMQDNEFSGRGVGAIQRNLDKIGKSFHGLDFNMVIKNM